MSKEKTETIETTMYDGKVTLYFYPKSHRYKVTDEEMGLEKENVKGVTTILNVKEKSSLVPWAVESMGLFLCDALGAGETITEDVIRTAMREHDKIKTEAGDHGKITHEWIENFINHKISQREGGDLPPPSIPKDEKVNMGVMFFLNWYRAQKDIVFVGSERFIYSREHTYCGTLDIEAIVDGHATIIDIKTSNGLYNTVLCQMSAYAMAREEEMQHDLQGAKLFTRRIAIRLPKETQAEYEERMERKAFMRGKEISSMPQYQFGDVLDVVGRDELLKDFQAFQAMKVLALWDGETNKKYFKL